MFLQTPLKLSIAAASYITQKLKMGQGISMTQFYFYGRKHFRQPGYMEAQKHYTDPVQTAAHIGLHQASCDGVSLQDKVVVITGANSGIGMQQATYAAAKGATLFMVCRSNDKAQQARDDILKLVESDPPINPDNVKILLCDVGELAQVRTMVQELQSQTDKVDVLVCNAGVLLNDRTETSEGNEVTFASHFLGGSYLLSTLLLPQLKAAPESSSRVIFTSSGGMYGNPWPKSLEEATSQGKYKKAYNGNTAYSYAKRGQVLLAEQYAKLHPDITWVSAHPGWTSTPAVASAYGDSAKYLEPMRSPWEGAEGITWLFGSGAKLQQGAFYLDRSPQRKHISGPFFTEGSYTKNSPEEVEDMMKNLKEAAGL
jgi:dehydrogenase/reductase SDR family protein 12